MTTPDEPGAIGDSLVGLAVPRFGTVQDSHGSAIPGRWGMYPAPGQGIYPLQAQCRHCGTDIRRPAGQPWTHRGTGEVTCG